MLDVWPSNFALSFGGAPEMRVRAASIPSAEVPDIRPRTRSEFLDDGMGQGDFTTEGTENTEKKEEGGESW